MTAVMEILVFFMLFEPRAAPSFFIDDILSTGACVIDSCVMNDGYSMKDAKVDGSLLHEKRMAQNNDDANRMIIELLKDQR